MGGMGSGRYWHWSSKETTEQYLSLDVRKLAKTGVLEPGRVSGWAWHRDVEKVAEIHIRADARQIRLIYKCRSHGEDWEEMYYPVSLLSQPCNFGGHRQWFACPAQGCGKRVALLYAGRVFACRHCFQLAYECQREAPYQRSFRKAEKIRDRLGWERGLNAFPGEKPKGMHRRTYDRLVSDMYAWENASDQAFLDFYGSRIGDLLA